MSCTESDLLQPGLPTMKTGMRLQIATTSVKTFSRSASLGAVPAGSAWGELHKWHTVSSQYPPG